jgi:hypothetical protein
LRNGSKAASLWRATRTRAQERRHQRQLSPRARIARALPLQLKALKLIVGKAASLDQQFVQSTL